MSAPRDTPRTSAARGWLWLQLAVYRQGWAWPFAVFLLAIALAVTAAIAAPARAREAAARTASLRSTSPGPAASTAENQESAVLQRLDVLLRPEDGLEAEVRELYALASRMHLPIGQAQFSASADAVSGLRRLGVTLPVAASYADVRGFIAAALVELPNLSIDEIALTSGKGPGATLDVRLRLSLWGRPAAGLPRAPANTHPRSQGS